MPNKTACTNIMHFIPALLHRSGMSEAAYHPVSVSSCNQDLFLLCWSQTVAALSYVFENAEEKAIVQKAINGFRYVFIYSGTPLKWPSLSDFHIPKCMYTYHSCPYVLPQYVCICCCLLRVESGV